MKKPGSASPSIFESKGYREFLSEVRPLSLGQWVKKIGYRSPRSMGMVLRGQRTPSPEMVHAICRSLKLSASETRYFELLVLLERNRKHDRPTDAIVSELESLNPNKNASLILDEKTFSAISNWYHLVVRQLVGTAGFINRLSWIRKKLKHRVTLQEAKSALSTLAALKLIEPDGKGSYRLTTRVLSSTSDIPSQAIRAHHQQMIAWALKSLKEDPVDAREFTSITFRFDPLRTQELKQAIREFRTRINQEFGTEGGTEVGQMNLQFFVHTQPPA